MRFLQKRLFRIPLANPMLLYLLGALISALTAYDPWICVPFLIALGTGALAYVATIIIARDHIGLKQLVTGLVCGAALLACLVAFQYRYLSWEEKFGPAVAIGQLLSAPFPAFLPDVMRNNVAALLFEGILPLALGLAVMVRSWQRWLSVIAALLIGLGLFLTSSRGAWVALVAVSLVAGLAVLRMRANSQRMRQIAGVLGIIGVLILLATIVVAVLRPEAISSALFRAEDRSILYRNSFYMALEVPFTGVGGGASFGLAYAQLQLLIGVVFLTYAHNLFLSVWLAHGLLGLLGFCGMLVGTLRLVWRALPRLNPLGLGAALGCLGQLLHGLTDAPQYDQFLVIVVCFALFGMLIAATRLADPRPLGWLQLGRRAWVGFAVAICGGLILFGPQAAALAATNVARLVYLRAVVTMRDATPMARGQVIDSARTWAELGLRVAPASMAARKAHGMIDLTAEHYGEAISALEQAAPAFPQDQALTKALGYAYIWYGYTTEGAKLLHHLDRAREVRGELDTWQQVWRERGQPDLAQRAQAAAVAFDAER